MSKGSLRGAFESVEMVDLMMTHESGTKFYQLALFWPMTKTHGYDAVDTSKGALLQSRWGSVASSLNRGGAFSVGEFISCASGNNIGSVWGKIKNNKERRGYSANERIVGVTNHSVAKEAYQRASDLGFLDKGYKQASADFFGQFERPKEFHKDESGKTFYIDELGNAIYLVSFSFKEKLKEFEERAEEKVQKIRSPLFGSW